MSRIAIIIPAYNEKDNLKKLVECINQNLNSCEIYIIDDSKINNTEKTLEKFENINVNDVRGIMLHLSDYILSQDCEMNLCEELELHSVSLMILSSSMFFQCELYLT